VGVAPVPGNVVGRRRPTDSALAVAGTRVEYASERDTWLIHRPERVWPTTPRPGVISVAAVPEEVDPDAGGKLTAILPMLGSLGIVAFAFVAKSVVYLIVASVMVVAILAGTLGAKLAQDRRRRRQQARARAAWAADLEAADRDAGYAATQQQDGLLGLYPDLAGLVLSVQTHGALWERRPSHADFGSVRIGLGEVEAARPVRVDRGSGAPGARRPADLAALADEVEQRTASLTDAPVVVPLRSLSSVALVGPREQTAALAASWLAGLAATCAPTDLRMMACSADGPEWEWVKWLPHVRDPLSGDGFGRASRSWWSDPSEFAAALRGVVEPRLEQQRRASESGGWHQSPDGPAVAGEHVIALLADYDPFRHAGDANLDVLLDRGRELAATVVLLVEDPAHVPSRCGARVEIDVDGRCSYREAGPDGRFVEGIVADSADAILAERLARTVAPLQLADADAAADLVDTVRLVELLGHESADRIDPHTDWLTAPDLLKPAAAEPGELSATDLLAIPIGVRSDGAPLILDLKEAAVDGMGPHGMLIGATGSGKSELLRSLVSGMAARHSPDVLNVVLVDFKGGAAFADLGRLPHTAGLVTNLEDDPVLIDRMRESLDGEIERRQQFLRDAGNVESIRAYHDRYVDAPGATALPYLLVVVDEFGGLLQARPDFLDVFVKIGQLGRSLGVHLLLASQRLDEGRIRNLDSHLRYRICLRTYSAAESSAVIGTADAFELPPMPGLGYLRVDNTLVRFKAATTSLPYRPVRRTGPAPAVVRPFQVTRAVDLIPTDSAEGVKEAAADRPELQVIVERLETSAEPARQVWLPPLPDYFDLSELSSSHGAALMAKVGRLDDPARQAQEPLTLDLTGSGGHVGCVGGPRTGKTTFIRTLVRSLTGRHSPNEVGIYVLDLGGGLHDLAKVPQVGAVVGRHDPEAIARLIREARAIVEERSAAFRELGVTSLAELREHPRASELLPDPLAGEVVLAIDNHGVLRSEFPELDLELADLAATGLQMGVHIVLTANRWLDIRPALLDALGTRLELHINDPVDSVAGRAAAAALAVDRPGRGLLRDGRQFQIAASMPYSDGEASELAKRWGACHAPRVVPLPRRLPVADVPLLAQAAGRVVPDSDGFLLGVAEFRLAPVRLDPLASGQHLLVYGDQGSGRSALLRRAVRYLDEQDNVQVHVVDLGRGLLDVADSPSVANYAFTASLAEALAKDLVGELYERLPPPDLTRQQLLDRSWWRGPEHVVVVDDFDLTIVNNASPLGVLSDALAHGRDIGFHVILARQVAGSSRTSYESFGQRLREITPTALLLSGDRSEGPLVGERPATRQPAGRGMLLRRGHSDTVVQLAADPEVVE
jgi:S-DNA-T family DNA segregation ATPase FtsK/SpoIIIE